VVVVTTRLVVVVVGSAVVLVALGTVVLVAEGALVVVAEVALVVGAVVLEEVSAPGFTTPPVFFSASFWHAPRRATQIRATTAMRIFTMTISG
jgi:hypothetical protein